MDIVKQTIRNEGILALYKGLIVIIQPCEASDSIEHPGMASPLIGIAGVNSLLFAAYGTSRRIISPFPQLSLKETAAAGAMAGAVNSVLASPGWL